MRLKTFQMYVGSLLLFHAQWSVAENLNFDGVPNDAVNFLSVDKAFVFNAVLKEWVLTLSWDIAPNHYLYRDRIQLKTAAGQLVSLSFDHAAERKVDPSFGLVNIYHDHLIASVNLSKLKPAMVDINYQGCSEAGLCYPVQRLRMGTDDSGNGYSAIK